MDIENKVLETIEEYNLMEKGDRVVVALSGGKDSTSVLYILKRLGYDVHGLMIDLYLGQWSEIHKKNMLKFCEELGVPLTVVDLKKEIGQGICFVKAVLAKKKGLTGCTVCGIIKKWILNKWAKKLGADVIVTGHNLDDEAQNVLMNYLKGNVHLGARLAPMTGSQVAGRRSQVGKFAQRVKPLFFVPEGEVRKFAEGMKFDILYDKCPCSFATYRADTRDWMEGISDREKFNIVEGFQEIVPKLRVQNVRELKICSKCGEPSSGDVCKACGIFSCL